MVVRNMRDKEVLETTYLAHGGTHRCSWMAGY
jgi:hypothetical protein